MSHSNVPPGAPVVLEAEGLTSRDVKNVSFQLRRGEILGFAGLMGAGRTETMRLLCGTGGIDLSIGTVMMCSTLIGGCSYSSWGWPLWLSLLLIPVLATLFGALNGAMIVKLKLPPFIATLSAMMSPGLGAIITKVQTQRFSTIGSEDAWLKDVFSGTGSFTSARCTCFASSFWRPSC